jgi:glycosyltransferase involved in cell wall biosynthesis
MKVLIVEEALKGLHGHWFQYIQDICHGGKDAGHEIEVAVHRGACPEIRDSFQCHPILGENVFDAEAYQGSLAGVRRMIRRNVSLYRELRIHFKSGHCYDVVIATTPRIDHIYAYLLLNLLWGGKAYRQLVLIFVESVGVYATDFSILRFRKKSLPLKWGMKLAQRLPGAKRMALATESEGLVRHFRAFSGANFILVPHVTRWVESSKPQSVQERPLVLGTFGFTRYDKGADVLQAALRKLVAQGMPEGCRFVIQWTGDYSLPDGTLAKRDSELERRADVHYLPAFKRPEDFPDMLAQTDLMILPYRRVFYFDKLSRVAIDAAEAGMPIVYPKGTWIETFVTEFGAGVAFEPDDIDSLSLGLRTVVENYSELSSVARQRAVAAREAFSAKKFFEVIEAQLRLNS